MVANITEERQPKIMCFLMEDGFLELSKGNCEDVCFVLESLWVMDLYIFIMFQFTASLFSLILIFTTVFVQ